MWKLYNIGMKQSKIIDMTEMYHMLKASNHEWMMRDTQQQYFDVRTWYDR